MSKLIRVEDEKGQIIKSEVVQDKDVEETKKSFEKNLTESGKRGNIKVLDMITGSKEDQYAE
jgi:hypothetical protein